MRELIHKKHASLEEMRADEAFPRSFWGADLTPQAPDAMSERVGRVFRQVISAQDIAEPLLSFDATADAAVALVALKSRRTHVAGVRRAGLVDGFVIDEELVSGKSCGESARSIASQATLPASASLIEVVRASIEYRFVFIQAFGVICAVVSDEDLQKAPVRMWLFGLVSLIERHLQEVIELHLPNDSWMGRISPKRLERAQTLLEERMRNGEQPRLIDCLQFGDKSRIACGDAGIRKELGVRSRRQGEITFESLERLRNKLAHSQELVASDWAFVGWLLILIDYLIAMLSKDPSAASIRRRLEDQYDGE